MRLSFLSSIAFFVALSTHGVAKAQSLNLDMGDNVVPSPGFGAAAGQTGTWNRVGALNWSPPLPLVDLTGASAGVSVSTTSILESPNPWGGPLAGTAGDDELLLDDWLRMISGASPWTVLITPLQPGTYDVYTYALSPLNAVDVRVNGGVFHTVSGAWPGAYATGITHALETVTIGDDPALSIELSNQAIVSGVQLVRRDTPYVTFCEGNGFGPVPCPCSNFGATGRGCRNSEFNLGARLTATGIASATAANDTFSLSTQGVPTGFGLYFQGSAQSAPAVFGDGLLCLGGTITRLGIAASAAGKSTFPSPPGSALISQVGGVTAGDVRQYQLWYRDAASYCTAATFNLSNALRVTWQ